MDQPNWGIFAIACFGMALAAFLLGVDVAEGHAAKAKQALADRLKWEQQNHTALMKYVRDNWPNEYAAYQKGHSDGYQQGILQSPELEP